MTDILSRLNVENVEIIEQKIKDPNAARKRASRNHYRNHTQYYKDASAKRYKEHKDEFRIYYNERVVCKVCGKDYTRSNKSRHDATTFHLSHILDI